MTQEDKDLLLKDLCGRLPYGVKAKFGNSKPTIITSIEKDEDIFDDEDIIDIVRWRVDSEDEFGGMSTHIESVKPYLFPLSSMTKEQKQEYDSIIYHNVELHLEHYFEVIDVNDFEDLQEFYLKYHLDYHGLIRMGLAINATGLNIY